MIWKDLYKYPPRYYYNARTKTLGLDGHWGGFLKKKCGAKNVEIQLDASDDIFYHGEGQLNIYLDEHFFRHPNFGFVTPLLFSESYVSVSPQNKEYYAVDGILMSKKNNKPALEMAGEGLYKIIRNGKWGAIDEKLKVIIPIEYDYVCHCDKNGLFIVRHDEGQNMRLGLVDKHGEELVPPIYDTIILDDDGTYTAEKDGKKFIMKY